MEIDKLKYVTFRREELYQLWDEFLLGDTPMDSPEQTQRIIARMNEIEIDDAVVIRKLDRLSVGALHSYATSCFTTADVLEEAGRRKEADELTAIGNYFYEEYEQARMTHGHLPTP